MIQDGPGRSLEPIATKTNFDARIRAAAVFNNEEDPADIDFLVKLERQRSDFSDAQYPPQSLVLTLDSNDLVFLFLRTGQDGSTCFVQQTCPMPCFDRILFQPGEHLAIDPYSRALAVAANEREVIIYSAKPKTQIQQEMNSRSDTWCPVSAQRPLQIEGVIHQMEFLIPPSDDKDHIVLLLIVTDQRRTKAVRIDWHYSSGPHNAQLHPGQPLAPAKTVSSMLIPLRDASFLLVMGSELTRWKDILSGSASGTTLKSPEEPPKYPGVSSHAPMWASWAKPRRSQAAMRERDSIYLVREDGLVFFMAIDSRGGVHTSFAGDLDCHVGSAFASLGDEGDPDILAAAGDMSTGRVVSIGAWPSTREMETLSRDDTMNFDPVEMIPNWASVTDMVGAKQLSSSRNRYRNVENVMVTSGREPHGCITEIRRGVEARMAVYVSDDGFGAATDVWTLPSMGSIVVILSLPSATLLYNTSAEFGEWAEFEEATAFTTDRRTLAAGISFERQLIQVTDRGICASTSMHINFEDTLRMQCEDGVSILAASIPSEASTIVTAERRADGYSISSYRLRASDDAPGIEHQCSVTTDTEPLCLAAIELDNSILALSTTVGGDVVLVQIDRATQASTTYRTPLPSTSSEGQAVCDNVVILQHGKKEGVGVALLAMCGLRDGNIVVYALNTGRELSMIDTRIINFGYSTVRLARLPSEPSRACAMSDNTACLLSWDGISTQSLHLEDIWLTDKQQPELAQDAITAITQMPAAADLSFDTYAESLVVLTAEEFIVASLNQTPSTVPRQIPLEGTPNRLIHADSLRCMVSASLRTEVKLPQETRQIWPVIDFISTRGPSRFAYHMQPGERVNALLEWSYRSHKNSEKTYAFVIVGGSYVRHNGTRRGRVTFLQPTSRKWEIVEVNETQKSSFDQEVYSLGLYDPITYIACAGESLHLHRFRPEDTKWDQLCPPFRLASPGVHVSTETDHSGRKLIVVSTQKDSVVVLTLDEVSSESGSGTKFVLNPVVTGPRAEALTRHYVFDTTSALYSRGDIDLFTLAATRSGQLVGMASPKQPLDTEARHTVARIAFEAQLPRSMMRLARVPPPDRKGSAPPGVLPERIMGAATDGALMGIALLDDQTWRRLSWLQRLIEWSPELSPHSYQSPAYNPGGVDKFGQKGRALPIGFNADANDLAVLHTTNTKANDMHVDGDILSRALEKNGKEAITRVLQELAEMDSPVGAWVREHIENEVAIVQEAIQFVERLEAWM